MFEDKKIPRFSWYFPPSSAFKISNQQHGRFFKNSANPEHVMFALLALFVLSSFAFAGEPNTLVQPVVGASMLTVDGCASTVVSSPWNTRNAGKLAIDLAKAREICDEAQGSLEIAKARAKAIIARAGAEATLIAAAAKPVENGQSVSYDSKANGDMHLSTGLAAEWGEYSAAVSAGNSRMYTPGMMPAGGDPNLYRLAGGQTGAFYPTAPGQVAAETAECGTAAQCQAQVEALSDALAEKE